MYFYIGNYTFYIAESNRKPLGQYSMERDTPLPASEQNSG